MYKNNVYIIHVIRFISVTAASVASVAPVHLLHIFAAVESFFPCMCNVCVCCALYSNEQEKFYERR